MTGKLDKRRAEAERLREQINHHNYSYYALDAPEVTDAEYDVLMRQLEALEKAHPELLTPDSPTQRVGVAPSEKFAAVIHRQPMLSLANAMNAEEMLEFDRRIKRFLKDERISSMLPRSSSTGWRSSWSMKTDGWSWLLPVATASTARMLRRISAPSRAYRCA